MDNPQDDFVKRVKWDSEPRDYATVRQDAIHELLVKISRPKEKEENVRQGSTLTDNPEQRSA